MLNKGPYFIIEIANTHGGDQNYLKNIIKTFSGFKNNFGIKFQVFHPDLIATPDYPYYEVYKKLFFSKELWSDFISKAFKTKDVWLDIFDLYGVEVFRENISLIYGIKFQSSVLSNYEVLNALSNFNLCEKKIILNVAAQEINSISFILERVYRKLNPGEILLEFGYQAYPTAVEDSGINKITFLRKRFSNRLVFADHVNGQSDDALWLPVIALTEGADVIEKHVMLNDRKIEYDYFSSVTPERFTIMVEKVKRYAILKEMPFINEKEKEYLRKTVMIPLLRERKEAGSLIIPDKDLIFRRSGKNGINVNDIEELQNSFFLLSKEKNSGEVLYHDDFRKAKIAVVIACRLKSVRLPKKALLKIGQLASVEKCIKSAIQFKNIDYVVLATSDIEEDKVLENYTYNSNVIFHQGDPNDVIKRYLSAAEKLGIDIVLRVTADMPYVDDEIAQILLKSHFLIGADYTASRTNAVGTAIEVINVQALKKVKYHFPSANYSEYMTWYFKNNPEHFRLNIIDLPDELVRDYRLTLDYQEDLDMLNHIEAHFKRKKESPSARKIFKYLDEHPEIANINSHLTLRYKSDHSLISILNDVTKIK